MKRRMIAALAALTLIMSWGIAPADVFIRTQVVREEPADAVEGTDAASGADGEQAEAETDSAAKPDADEPVKETETSENEQTGTSAEGAAQKTESPNAPGDGTEEGGETEATIGTSTYLVREETEDDTRIARDISAYCTYNGRIGGPKHRLNDGVYAYEYKTGPRDGGIHALDIAVTEGEPMGAIYIQWCGDGVPLAVQLKVDGEWRTVATTDGDFFVDYIKIPECYECRLTGRDNPKQQLVISELTVFTAGKPADNIQIWQKAEGKIDLMLLSCHPDDELLWFGGTLPYYGGELGKNVLVICCAMNRNLRKLELCDALWACGVRIHPIYLHRQDISAPVQEVLGKWHAERDVLDWVTGYIRKYRPDVLLLHDVNGEYGHGAHRAASWIGRMAFEQAMDPSAWPESAALYGTWEVPKVYIHLWEENQIRMDWHQPLAYFGGMTGLEAAQMALEYHISQTEHGWKIQDGGEHDNSLFGLYHSTVGPDIEKNDFFENIREAD